MNELKNEWKKFKTVKRAGWPFKGKSINDFRFGNKLKLTKQYIFKNYKWIVPVTLSTFFSILSLINSVIPPEPKTIKYTYLVPTTISTENSLTVVSCKSSFGAKRNDAARCSLDGTFSSASLLDPCFLTYSQQNIVICPNNPYDESSIFELGEVKKEVVYEDFSEKPWYVILEDETECVVGYGGTRSIADSTYDYDCNGQYINLVSPIEKDESVWEIRCLKKDDKRLEFCRIKSVWF